MAACYGVLLFRSFRIIVIKCAEDPIRLDSVAAFHCNKPMVEEPSVTAAEARISCAWGTGVSAF